MKSAIQLLVIFILPAIIFAQTPVSPADGAYGVSQSIGEVTWTNFDDGNGNGPYDVEFGDDPTFVTLLASSYNTSSTSLTIPVLAHNTIYYWRVRDTDIDGLGDNGAWNVYSFQTPFLTSPANLQSGISITPYFTWDTPAGDGANYTLEIATDNAFSNIVFTQGAIAFTNYQLPLANKLDNATIYYWRVTASGGAYSVGRFSTIFAAYTNLVSPTNLSTIVGNTINFQWTIPAGNLKYVVEVDDNPNFLSQASGFPTSASAQNFYNHTYTLTTLPANDYFWRVKVYTDTDVLISVSSAWKFTISGPPTAVPAYPINLTTVYSNSPIIYWYLNNYYYNQGVYYRVRYGLNPGVYNQGTSPITTNNWVPLPGLTIGQTYYYVIDASNSDTFGTYTTSEEGSFVVFYSAIASIPVYQSFPLGNTVYSLTPTLYWFLGVHVPGVAFDIQVNDGTDFTSNLPLEVDVSGVSAYQYQTPVLTAGTSYIWRVRITGSTAWYGPETFFIDPSTTPDPSPLDINIPVPSSPIGGTIVSTQSPVLTWVSTSVNILEYQIIYSSDPTLNLNGVLVNVNPPNNANGGTSGWLLTNNYALSGLTPGVTYYWQVRSRLASPPNTVSNFSSVAQFTVAPGANPIVVLPANPIVGSTINGTSAKLSWIVPVQSESALSYELEISSSKDMSSSLRISNLEKPNYEITNLSPNSDYYWRVRSKTSDGLYSDYSFQGVFKTDGVTNIQETNIMPLEFNLAQNYPNPFNPFTRISFAIPSKSFVTLTIYDMLGREVNKLINEDLNAGTYNVDWNGKDLFGNKVASGTYIYRISAGKYNMSKKMILLK